MKDVDCPWGIFLDLYAIDPAADFGPAYFYQMWATWFWGKILILRSVPRPYLYVHGLLAKAVTGACVAAHEVMKWLHIPKSSLIKLRDRHSRRYERRVTRRLAYFCDPLPYKNVFALEDMYPLQDLAFEDMTIPFPKNLDALLTKMYGDYMTPPPVEKRKTHFPYELDFGPYKDFPIPEALVKGEEA